MYFIIIARNHTEILRPPPQTGCCHEAEDTFQESDLINQDGVNVTEDMISKISK